MRSHKISFSYFLNFMFWLTYFRPLILERFSPLLDNIWYVFHFILFLFLMIFKAKTISANILHGGFKSSSYIFLVTFFVWNFFCVITMATGTVTVYILEVVHVLELILVFKSTKGEKIRKTLNLFGDVSNIYIWLNFLSIICFKNGMFLSHVGSSSARVQWLLGSKNSIPIYIIIFMIGVKVKSNYKYKRLPYITLIAGILSVLVAGSHGVEFMGGSSAGIMACLGLFAMFIYTDFYKNKSMPIFLNAKVDIICIIVINIIILGGAMIPLINDLIVSVFHKTLDYSGRRAIWEFAIENISKSPIVGHGASKFGLNIFFESSVSIFTTYVYNMFLRLWLRYGIISVLLFVFVVINLQIRMDYLCKIAMSGLLGICIFGLMNEVDFNNMFLPIIIIEEVAFVKNKCNSKSTYLII